jgi:hypothetical protein
MVMFRMDPGQMTSRIRGLAMEHTGVGVTPHLYHDIVAFEWLRCHPKDYLTLSKILWHRNSQGSAGQTRSGTPAQKLGL